MNLRIWALAAAGAALTLAACETTEGYQARMNMWVGRTSDDLTVDWGAPNAKAPLTDGREVWSYSKTTVRQQDGYYQDETRQVKRKFTDKDGKEKTETIEETYPVWKPPQTFTSQCDTRFVIGASHRVEQVSFNGDGCIATLPDQ